MFLMIALVSAEKNGVMQQPEWELGVGGLSVPHYRGSDQRAQYVAAIPYVRYNGKRLTKKVAVSIFIIVKKL